MFEALQKKVRKAERELHRKISPMSRITKILVSITMMCVRNKIKGENIIANDNKYTHRVLKREAIFLGHDVGRTTQQGKCNEKRISTVQRNIVVSPKI